MKHIALKIDVDTCRGTLTGVPALIDLLLKHQAQASFFFSLGPDHGGREIHATSLSRYYDLRTRLYGRLLPGPDIGKRCGEIIEGRVDVDNDLSIEYENKYTKTSLC